MYRSNDSSFAYGLRNNFNYPGTLSGVEDASINAGLCVRPIVCLPSNTKGRIGDNVEIEK